MNEQPYGDGWLVVIAADDIGALDELLDASEYRSFVEGEGS